MGRMQFSCHMSEMEFHNYDNTVTGFEIEGS